MYGVACDHWNRPPDHSLVWLEKSPLLAWGGLRVHAPVSLFLNDILKQLPILSILVFTLTPLGDIEFGIIVS